MKKNDTDPFGLSGSRPDHSDWMDAHNEATSKVVFGKMSALSESGIMHTVDVGQARSVTEWLSWLSEDL